MTKRRPLKVGERVVAYECGGKHWGTIVKINQDELGPHPVLDSGESFHEKQCRRLILKPKLEKRERVVRWLKPAQFSDLKSACYCYPTEKQARESCYEQAMVFRLEEVPADSRVVSREEVLQAFGLAFTMPGNTHKQMDATLGLALLKALGFHEGEKK